LAADPIFGSTPRRLIGIGADSEFAALTFSNEVPIDVGNFRHLGDRCCPVSVTAAALAKHPNDRLPEEKVLYILEGITDGKGNVSSANWSQNFYEPFGNDFAHLNRFVMSAPFMNPCGQSSAHAADIAAVDKWVTSGGDDVAHFVGVFPANAHLLIVGPAFFYDASQPPLLSPILKIVLLDGSGPTGGDGTNPGGGSNPTPTPTPTPGPTTPAVVFPDTFFDNPIGLENGQSVQIPFSIFVPQDFNKDVTLSASSSPEGLDLTFDKTTISAPGSGDAVLTISAGPDTFPIDRQVAIMATFIDENGNPVTSTATFPVSLVCDPPKIFGTNQPRDTRGSTVAVTANGSGPFRYQWFAGSTGQTHFPISGATDRTLTLPAVTGATPFWVRVSNACGSVDSNTVIVTPR